MLILHTCWRDTGCYIWGEQPAMALDVASGTSPFDPGPERLCATLSEHLEGARVLSARPEDIELLFPTPAGASYPLPSQLFLLPQDHVEPAQDRAAPLQPWRVTAIRLSWRQTFEWFNLIQDRQFAEHLFAAEDMIAFSEVFRYAGALVARGRYLPDLRRTARQEHEAIWSPCIDCEEDSRIAALARRLPPASYCGEDPITVVEAILTEWLDRLVRVSVTTTLSRAQAERGKSYSAHDAWFSALRGESRLIRWPLPDELDVLKEQLEHWRHPITATRRRDDRPILHLKAPDTAEQPWCLDVVFPSGTLRALSENSLFSLGQAAFLFPPLAHATLEAACLRSLLEITEAHQFLTAAHALIEAAGYEVHLPENWHPNEASGIALTADVTPHALPDERTTHLRPDESVDIRWTVTFNREPISVTELEELLAAPSPLVFFRGRWIIADVRQLQSALRIARQTHPETETAMDAIRLALGATGSHQGVKVEETRGHGRAETLFSQLSGDASSFELLHPPEGFSGTLRPYQIRGFSWLVFLRTCGFGACLADDMGLGKTIQALAFLIRERRCGAKGPALIVGPLSVLGNWFMEAQRFAPELRCRIHHGAERVQGHRLLSETTDVDVLITSYALLYRDYAHLRQVKWSTLILDEAQNIKNPDTRQARAARALAADYRIALTGTPMENHVGDLWSIMDFLNPGILGTRSAFREHFFRPVQSGTDPSARSRLKRITSPFILRRLKTDKQIISDLPEKIENKIYCPLTAEQIRLYQEELTAFQADLDRLEGIDRRGLILAVLTRLKQICNHPEHYLGSIAREDEHRAIDALDPETFRERSGKLVRLEEQLEEVFACGESALIFTQYAAMGHLLNRRLCEAFGRDMPYLHGGITRHARERMIRQFQTSTEPQAFVLSLKAGGTGLNLTRATHVFHYDRWWNPAVENQATDRAFRIGQTQRVMVHKYICNGTLEDRIDAMIENKSALASEIITHGEHALTELSNDALRELLDLAPPSLREQTSALSI